MAHVETFETVYTPYPGAIQTIHIDGAGDAHGVVTEGDIEDSDGAVGAQQQSRRVLASVTRKIEPRQIATGRAKTERVWHTHVAARGAAVTCKANVN
jgi:hypothetical protein